MTTRDVQSILSRYESAPEQEPMHGQAGQIRRAPSTDQKKVRNQLKRKQADLEEGTIVTQTHTVAVAQLLRRAEASTDLAERQNLLLEVEQLRTQASLERDAADGFHVEGAKIRDVMVPGRVHERTTTDTDWLLGLQTTASLESGTQSLVAEATMWFGRVSDDVKSYPEEFAEQARNIARRTAGKFGDEAQAAERLFLDEAARLHGNAVRAGLVTLAASEEYDPEPTQRLAASTLPQVAEYALPPDTFSTLNGGAALPPEATSSNRAPALQEIQNYDGWNGTSVVPQGDSGAASANDSGPTRDAAAGDVNLSGFPVGSALHTTAAMKESHMEYAPCPSCGGHGKVAVRVHDPKTAYSGLPQIDQIMNPSDTGQEPTPYPADVAFPLVWDPNNVPSAISQAEQQIAERNKKSPLASGTASRHQAAGDDSGWIGDMGGKGLNYPGYSTPNYGNESNLGQPDPVWGTGGDNGNQPMKPYGAEEAADYTNNPDDNWQHGQPTQDDQGYREVTPGLNTQGSRDPYVIAAQQEILRQQAIIASRIRAGR